MVEICTEASRNPLIGTDSLASRAKLWVAQETGDRRRETGYKRSLISPEISLGFGRKKIQARLAAHMEEVRNSTIIRIE